MPHRYAAGKRQIEEAFGVKVLETPNAMRDTAWLYRNAKAGTDDLHWALCNDAAQAIFTTIGGYESVRILPHLEYKVSRQHPKIMMGSSDTTVTLTAFLRDGVIAFNGPPVMCDLAENCGIRPFVAESVRAALFAAQPFQFQAAESWTEEFLEWRDPTSQSRERKFVASDGWVWLQGNDRLSGRLVIPPVLAEFDRGDLPVVANMDFGHTSPQMVVPMGCRAMIDTHCEACFCAGIAGGVTCVT